jgi:dTDP-4-dehydrorhamnose 3,5-epimerase
MIFNKTLLEGVYVIELDRHEDDRGFFARSWCQHEFENHGLNPRLAQCNISYNRKKGTLRGMHFQADPYAEAKLMRCTMGAVYDVVVDLRPESPTFMMHFGITLTPQEHNMVYAPEGLGHGFLTLVDESEVFYQMSEFYAPDSARGFRWNDPAFGIDWPIEVKVISERDATYPDFSRLDGANGQSKCRIRPEQE